MPKHLIEFLPEHRVEARLQNLVQETQPVPLTVQLVPEHSPDFVGDQLENLLGLLELLLTGLAESFHDFGDVPQVEHVVDFGREGQEGGFHFLVDIQNRVRHFRNLHLDALVEAFAEVPGENRVVDHEHLVTAVLHERDYVEVSQQTHGDLVGRVVEGHG